MRKGLLVGLILAGVAVVGTALAGCRSPIPRRNPTGEVFPSVVGESLEQVEVRLPEAFAGQPVLLLVGYEQRTQFDLDRWLLGLHQAGVDIAVREVPTIPGLLPGMFANFIDSGMRKGIPDEDWGSVITVYGDAGKIAAFTGTETPLPGRVLLLDSAGRVAFFHHDGYSVGSLARLEEAIRGLGR